jgi:hypothetical protein
LIWDARRATAPRAGKARVTRIGRDDAIPRGDYSPAAGREQVGNTPDALRLPSETSTLDLRHFQALRVGGRKRFRIVPTDG